MMATVVLDIFKYGNMYSERNQEKDILPFSLSLSHPPHPEHVHICTKYQK
jgi:hypothetical protein